MKNIVSEIKNVLDNINSSLNIIEEKISECQNTAIETTQSSEKKD